MRALVTGSTGFLGSHLVRTLIDSGDRVAVLLRPESTPWRIRDCLDELRVLRAESPVARSTIGDVHDFRPEVIYHLAWAGSHGGSRNDPGQLHTNLTETAAVLGLAAATQCSALIGVGSQAEYGACADVLQESTPLRPQSAYGVAKLAAGVSLCSIGPVLGIRCAWLRLLSAYGPMDDPTYVIPYMITQLLGQRSPRLTSATQWHDTLFCADVAEALRAAAASDRCRGAYVLASGAATTLREVAETVRALIGPDAPAISYGPASGHPGWRGSAARLSDDAGWKARTPLAAGLAETIDWYRNHADS
ncbi:MAG TPA: NAD(P)-dependent oxidoreductase [Candidatus Binatia bacterium]|nr:NAD(P)-dependent oxidoreductase [Candidatus Binatia bacterium]